MHSIRYSILLTMQTNYSVSQEVFKSLKKLEDEVTRNNKVLNDLYNKIFIMIYLCLSTVFQLSEESLKEFRETASVLRLV